MRKITWEKACEIWAEHSPFDEAVMQPKGPDGIYEGAGLASIFTYMSESEGGARSD